MHENGFLRQESRERIHEILLAQEFNAMIPAQLPDKVKVAHKTGEISTHSHDAGLVFPEGRAPYVVAIFTQSEAGRGSADSCLWRKSRQPFTRS
jgi:beta-lactamase class A